MTDVVHKQNQSQMALNHAQLTRQHQLVLTDIYTNTEGIRGSGQKGGQVIRRIQKGQSQILCKLQLGYK